MKKTLLFSAITVGAPLLCSDAFSQTYNYLNPIFSFGPNLDGTIRPGDAPYVTTGDFQRGLSYNPATDNFIFIDRQAGSAANSAITGNIYVLYSLEQIVVYTLNTNGMGGGDFADCAAAVADDGTIYVGNMVNDGTSSAFKLYRWPSESSPDPPVVVYSGDPGHGKPQRWGDTMDIRGSGAATQILLGTRSAGTALGTNVAILTTADGINFTATTIATDVGTASVSAGGIAFGAGNTFWAKNVDTPLRLFSFDLAAGQAVTVHSYSSATLSGTTPPFLAASRTLEAMAVDNAHNLLAIVDFTPATDHVRLYDISDLSQPPLLLDVKDFPVNNPNGVATKGYLDFGGGNLYVHDMNNGLAAYTIDTAALQLPIIVQQPISPGRVLAGRSASFEVLAFPRATYQWQLNGGDIPDATNAVLVIASVQTANAGSYHVVVQNAAGSKTSDDVSLRVANPDDLSHLVSVWSAAPGVQPYVTSTGGANTPNERGIGYNALSNQLYVVQRVNGGNNYIVHVVDAATGAKLYNLKTNGILPVVTSEVSGANGIGLVAIAVAEDGAIYACNESPNAYGGNPLVTGKLFRVYRWANSDSNTLPVQIFSGDPAGQSTAFRWGDVLSARGSGLGTQLLLDNQNASARYLALLRPSDASMTSFPAQFFTQDTASIPGTTIGRSLQFGTGNTIWQKRKGAALVQSSFDPAATPPNNVGTVLATYTALSNAVGEVGLDLSTRNLLVGIDYGTVTTAPDTLDLIDFSDPNVPVALAQYNFPVNHQANANFIGQVIVAGDKVFALDGNNGIVAFRIVSGPQNPPAISGQPQNLRVIAGNSGTLSVLTPDSASFQWQFNNENVQGATNSSYNIANITMGQAGPYRVIVSNDAGSVTSLTAVVTVLLAECFPHLAPCWSQAPESQSYLPADPDSMGRTPLYRGIAYNALSNEVYVISRTSASAGLSITVLDATTGQTLHQLDTSIITGGSIVLLAMAVAEDGALYAANMDTSGTGSPAAYHLYRWANSAPATVPTLVFSGEPAGQTSPFRWGDSMDARGSGQGTEIIIDENSGVFADVLTPTDGTMSAFVNHSFAQAYGGGSIGRSLRFGANNTFWQKRKGARLQLSSYDLAAKTSAPLTNYSGFPGSLGPVDLNLAHKILAGVSFASSTNAPDTLDLYDISDFNNPLRIAGYAFPLNQRLNGNFVGQVLFASNKVYAVDGNNGIIAFTVVPPVGPLLSIVRSGSDVILTWPSSPPGFVLQTNSTLAPLGWADDLPTPTPANGQITVTDPAATGNKFYRLRKP